MSFNKIMRAILAENSLRNLDGRQNEILQSIPEIEKCLEDGADPNSEVFNEKTGKQYEDRPLPMAIRGGNTVIIGLLIAYGASIEAMSMGSRPLHVAVEFGDIAIVKLLIKHHDADTDSQDSRGCTPLHLAIINDQYDIAKYLVEQGANTDVENNTGYTVKNIAPDYGDGNEYVTLVSPPQSIFSKYCSIL